METYSRGQRASKDVLNWNSLPSIDGRWIILVHGMHGMMGINCIDCGDAFCKKRNIT